MKQNKIVENRIANQKSQEQAQKKAQKPVKNYFRNLTLLTTVFAGALALNSCKDNITNNYYTAAPTETQKVDTTGYKSVITRVVSIGETLDAGNIKVKLEDISLATGPNNIHSAIVSILDANGAILNQTMIDPNSMAKFTVGGKDYYVVCFETAAGFTLNAKWAKLGVFEK